MGSKYIGLTIDWDHLGGEVHISTTWYVQKALNKFHHSTPTKRQDSPYPIIPQNLEQSSSTVKMQTTDQRTKKLINRSQELFCITLKLLMGPFLILSVQLPHSIKMPQKNQTFFGYCASWSIAVINRQSEMVLEIHSDSGYLNKSNSCSQPGGHIFSSNNTKFHPNNGTILKISQIIWSTISSVVKAELGKLYIN